MDSRQQTLENIRSTRQVVQQWIQLMEEYNWYFRVPIPYKEKRIVNIIIIVLAFLTLGIIGKIVNFHGFTSWFVLILIIGCFYILVNKINRNTIQKRIEANKSRVDEISHIMERLPQELQAVSEVPQAYWNDYALSQFEVYFANKRADTLKEAINLFEADMQHMQRLQEMAILQQQQVETMNEARKANQLGYLNLFINATKR